MNVKFLSALSASLVLGVAATVCAETLESVEKAIIERAKDIKSMSFKSTYWSEDQSSEYKSRSEGQTSYEYTMKGEMPLYRMESSTKTMQEMGGEKTTTMGKTLAVCDGKFVYMYNDYGDFKQATKSKATNDVSMMISSSYFDGLRQMYDLTLKPDATVGPKSAWVILAKLKQQTPSSAAEQDMYFDKESGVMVKSVARNGEGKVTMETNTTELKINSTISEDRFVFEAPEGVEVVDMTQQQGQADSQNDATASGENSNTAKADADEEPKEEKQEKKGVLGKIKKP